MERKPYSKAIFDAKIVTVGGGHPKTLLFVINRLTAPSLAGLLLLFIRDLRLKSFFFQLKDGAEKCTIMVPEIE